MKKQLPYSPAARAGNMVFISGQIGVDPLTKESSKDFVTQILKALSNLQSVLETEGLSVKDVVKTTVFLTNMDDFETMNEIYEKFFPRPRPARSTVAVKELPRIGDYRVLVEVEAVAYTRDI